MITIKQVKDAIDELKISIDRSLEQEHDADLAAFKEELGNLSDSEMLDIAKNSEATIKEILERRKERVS